VKHRVIKPNRDYYDEFAATYERERHAGYHRLIDRLETEIALSYARGGRVLEAGCGTGLILKEIRPAAESAVGLDLSAAMLSSARGRGLPVVQASVTHIPFPSNHFDLALCFKVLAHVEAIAEAMAELGRVVRPGGHVIAEFYNPWSLRYLIKRWKRPSAISRGTTDAAVYTRYDQLASIRGYLPPGLEIVDVRGLRVLTPFAQVHRWPLVSSAFAFFERKASALPGLRRLGGFLVVVARKCPPVDSARPVRGGSSR